MSYKWEYDQLSYIISHLPNICILVFLWAGGVAEQTEAADPTFSLSQRALFDFFPENIRELEKKDEMTDMKKIYALLRE